MNLESVAKLHDITVAKLKEELEEPGGPEKYGATMGNKGWVFEPPRGQKVVDTGAADGVPQKTAKRQSKRIDIDDEQFLELTHSMIWDDTFTSKVLGVMQLVINSCSEKVALLVNQKFLLEPSHNCWELFFMEVARKKVNQDANFSYAYDPPFTACSVKNLIGFLNTLARNKKLRGIQTTSPAISYLEELCRQRSKYDMNILDKPPWKLADDKLGIAPHLLKRVLCEPIFRMLGYTPKWCYTNVLLKGGQGCGKSTLAKDIWPPDLTMNINSAWSLNNRYDSLATFQGKTSIEVAESEAIEKLGEAAKDIFTSDRIKGRRPKEGGETSFLRTNAWVLTSNADKPLPDTIAGRRFVVVDIESEIGDARKWFEDNSEMMLCVAYKLVKRAIKEGPEAIKKFIPDFFGEPNTEQRQLFYEAQRPYVKSVGVEDPTLHLQSELTEIFDNVGGGRYSNVPWTTRAVLSALEDRGNKTAARNLPRAMDKISWLLKRQVKCANCADKQLSIYFPPTMITSNRVDVAVTPEMYREAMVADDAAKTEDLYDACDVWNSTDLNWQGIETLLDSCGEPPEPYAGHNRFPFYSKVIWGACAACREFAGKNTDLLQEMLQNLIDYVKEHYNPEHQKRQSDYLKLIKFHKPGITSATLIRAAKDGDLPELTGFKGKAPSVAPRRAVGRPKTPCGAADAKALENLVKASDRAVEELIPYLEGLKAPHRQKIPNDKGGFYWCVNYTKWEAKIKPFGTVPDDLIEAAHFVYYEIDNLSLEEQLKTMWRLDTELPVCFCVFSGNKSLHVYVKLDQPIYDIRKWRYWQVALANKVGGDLSVVNPGRLMRVPLCRNGQQGYVINADASVTHQQVDSVLGCAT